MESLFSHVLFSSRLFFFFFFFSLPPAYLRLCPASSARLPARLPSCLPAAVSYLIFSSRLFSSHPFFFFSFSFCARLDSRLVNREREKRFCFRW